MKKISLSRLLFFILCLPLIAWAEELSPAGTDSLPPLPDGPLLLTSATPEQLSPDYWIKRLPDPDRPLKAPEEIALLNEDIHREIHEAVDVFALDLVRPGQPVRDQIEFEYETIKGRILFGVDDQRIPSSFFEQTVRPVVAWENISNRIRTRWGAAVRATSVRALPTDVKMLEEIGDIEFDQLQFTLIKLWTPVAILHVSADGKWFYIQAPYTRGWVKARDIAVFPSQSALKKSAKQSPQGATKAGEFLVVTGESVPIYRDAGLQNLIDKPSMGTILPLAEEFSQAYAIWMPTRGTGGKAVLRRAYIDLKSDVNRGFLSYTQRNVIRQAFKLLGARYGWGGTYGGRDCSGFTQDVFLPFGIDMPRGSKDQTFVGTQIDHFKPFEDLERKAAAIRSGTLGVTLLKMRLHQMIYLGEVNGHFYVIHSTWAERIAKDSDLKRRINQVVLSDLSLNGQSYLGSLFDRIISISEVD